jgi:hypothetical protein
MSNSDEVIEALRSACRAKGSVQEWAEENGFHPSFVGRVLKGNQKISERLLDAIGYEFVGHYRKKGNAS